MTAKAQPRALKILYIASRSGKLNTQRVPGVDAYPTDLHCVLLFSLLYDTFMYHLGQARLPLASPTRRFERRHHHHHHIGVLPRREEPHHFPIHTQNLRVPTTSCRALPRDDHHGQPASRVSGKQSKWGNNPAPSQENLKRTRTKPGRERSGRFASPLASSASMEHTHALASQKNSQATRVDLQHQNQPSAEFVWNETPPCTERNALSQHTFKKQLRSLLRRSVS